MYDAVLSTVRSAGPMNLDEMFADLEHQHWIGQQHDPPIEVDIPRTKYELVSELDRLGQEGLIRCGPNGWEPLYVPAKSRSQPQKTLF
jgi:hypothetical protein